MSEVVLHQEIKDRIKHQYELVDGFIEYPNSFDGDVLRMAYHLCVEHEATEAQLSHTKARLEGAERIIAQCNAILNSRDMSQTNYIDAVHSSCKTFLANQDKE